MGLTMGDFLHVDTELRAGSRIEARFLASTDGEAHHNEYFPGTATAVHADGSVDVQYDDGDQEESVHAHLVKLLQPADEAVCLSNIRRAVVEVRVSMSSSNPCLRAGRCGRLRTD